ncbi:heme-copper oxidase subunit III [Luteolibacter yonseiensis]|uniref:Heme-copper oxidase subunit III n=1 Tax=Luteolibacter yonseiensis TaxID=1144680 RepID=A0A934VAJ2_9BACT|nr:cytochrome c oxidase subunit 3 [Luteolibacter yonseiensis]MBK1815210.1 heme-copper oxidase subunit III [Luteolibacter yonseiensis]
MEIPYVVTPRKDTGLFNSKIAIWLFLASEVMLFGGFFSAYVFLRLGADYPWPERTLPVLPGLINTFVLIFSSVTVVFAWAQLKLRNWRMFQVYMTITVLCALVFMVLKGIEYNVKFHHQALRLKDYTVLEGHLGYEKDDSGKEVLDHNGDKIEENMIYVKASKLTFNTVRFYKPWVEEFLTEAKHHNAQIVLSADVAAITKEGEPAEVIAKAGETLSVALLEKIKKAHLAARSHNGHYRTEALRSEWKDAKAKNKGKSDWQFAADVNIDMTALAPKLLGEIPSVAFDVNPPTKLDFKPRDIKEADGTSTLRDDTVVSGELLASPMVFHYVDAIDFQHLVMKAEQKGIDPEVAIENSWLIKNSPFAKEAWEWHLGKMKELKERLLKEYGVDKNGNPKRVPTHKELYRLGWKDLAKMGEEKHGISLSSAAKIKEEFMGPNYEARNPHAEEAGDHGHAAEGHAAEGHGKETFPHFSVPREQIGFAAKFTPAWNTYYAIYFTMTGLHGLHVIGGALVLAYYLLFGKKMYDSNPEWLANRVEVGGLFWHFVDLVWIFVFPILYLM